MESISFGEYMSGCDDVFTITTYKTTNELKVNENLPKLEMWICQTDESGLKLSYISREGEVILEGRIYDGGEICVFTNDPIAGCYLFTRMMNLFQEEKGFCFHGFEPMVTGWETNLGIAEVFRLKISKDPLYESF